MNSKAAVCVVVALSMASSGLAFGQGRGNDEGRGDRNDHGRNEQAQRGGDNRGGDNERSHFNRSGHDERGFGRGHNDESRNGRGVGPNHEYYRGDLLPLEYRHRQYVVDDWRSHNLGAPPRGYHWVQSGGDFILVAIATGVILQLLLGR
jgi:Ni/Co efflux regulator RcnB